MRLNASPYESSCVFSVYILASSYAKGLNPIKFTHKHHDRCIVNFNKSMIVDPMIEFDDYQTLSNYDSNHIF